MQAVLGGKERRLMREYAFEMAFYVQELGCISTPKDASERFKYIQYTAGLEVRMHRLLRGKHGHFPHTCKKVALKVFRGTFSWLFARGVVAR